MTDTTPQHRPPLVLDVIYHASAIAFSVYMFYYYWTGAGGETLQALTDDKQALAAAKQKENA